MFIDFVRHPYPRIYVSLNLCFLIKISEHTFLSFKTVFREAGNMTVTLIIPLLVSYKAVKYNKNIGIIHFAPFNYLKQHR